MTDKKAAQEYWKKNRTLIALLLSIWFLVSFVFSIFLGRWDWGGLTIGELPPSFWWAQQGSIFVFVILIFIYATVMDRLDKRYGLRDEDKKGGRQ